MSYETPALAERAYTILSGDDATDRACEAISDSACTSLPRNYLLNVMNGACTKLAEQLASPGLVLPWLLGSLGAPAVFAAYLQPVKQAGSLVPQLAVADAIRGLATRKWVWTAAGLTQAASLLAMILAALSLQGWAAGLAIVMLMAVFSIASGVGSVAFQDVTGKTVPKGQRGRMLSNRAALGGGLTLLAAAYLRFGPGEGAAQEISTLLILIGVAALLWAMAALLFASITEAPGASEGGRSMLSEVRAGWRLLKETPAFRRYMSVRALLLSVELATPFFALHAQAAYGGALGALALYVMAIGFANVISSPFWGAVADKDAPKVMSRAGLIAAAAGGLALTLTIFEPFGGQSWPYGAVFILIGLAEAGVRLGRKTYLVDAAPKDERALYTAFSNTGIGLLALAFGALGIIVDLLGAGIMIALLTGLSLSGALLARSLPAPDDFTKGF